MNPNTARVFCDRLRGFANKVLSDPSVKESAKEFMEELAKEAATEIGKESIKRCDLPQPTNQCGDKSMLLLIEGSSEKIDRIINETLQSVLNTTVPLPMKDDVADQFLVSAHIVKDQLPPPPPPMRPRQVDLDIAALQRELVATTIAEATGKNMHPMKWNWLLIGGILVLVIGGVVYFWYSRRGGNGGGGVQV